VHIPKPNGKLRPLGIPVMKDRAMHAVQLQALEPIAETTADKNSYGFRPGRSTADAIGQCFLALGKPDSALWILEGDIRGCFDNISHEWMLRHIPTDKEMLRKWLKAGFMENRILFPTEAGTPQGGIISPTLANLALDGLEPLLKEKFPAWRKPNPKVNLVRYADDFIITGATKELLENEVKPLVEQFMRDRGLQLSPEKTCVTSIEQGFDFLGQNLRKFGGRLLTRPSKKNTHAFLEKARQCIRANDGVSQAKLIRRLNPIIRGWANYHRHIVAMETFKKVEWVLRNSLWRWAKRRHRDKSAQWVFQRYWHPLGGEKVFAADTGQRAPGGKPLWLKLVNPTQTGIRRHVKIRAAANPFAPGWRAYFEDRAFFKKFGIHRREAGLKPSSQPAPQPRGFGTAGAG
jgi:RNA-directed DNA polymerase